MDKQFRERIPLILPSPTGTHKPPTSAETLHPHLGSEGGRDFEPYIDLTTQTICFQISSEEQSLPIKAMLKSLPLWTMCLGTMNPQWLVNNYIVYIPTYISSVFKINIRDVSRFHSFPSLCLHGSSATQVS